MCKNPTPLKGTRMFKFLYPPPPSISSLFNKTTEVHNGHALNPPPITNATNRIEMPINLESIAMSDNVGQVCQCVELLPMMFQ